MNRKGRTRIFGMPLPFFIIVTFVFWFYFVNPDVSTILNDNQTVVEEIKPPQPVVEETPVDEPVNYDEEENISWWSFAFSIFLWLIILFVFLNKRKLFGVKRNKSKFEKKTLWERYCSLFGKYGKKKK